MASERNPFLPETPADGRHDWGDSATDLGGNYRCLLCGAYKGSDEGTITCRGEYAESGKMRAWAAEQWRQARLEGDDEARVQHVLELVRRTKGGVKVGGVLFCGAQRFEALLDCGCRRPIADYEDARAIEEGRVRRVGCVDEHCIMGAVRAHQKLNPGAEVQP